MALDFCRLIMLLIMPTTVILSMKIGVVGGCGCPSSLRVSRRIFASFALRKMAPSSDAAADEATNFKISRSVCMAPFNTIGLPPIGNKSKKKYPPSRMRDLGTVKYYTSECMFRIISDA